MYVVNNKKRNMSYAYGVGSGTNFGLNDYLNYYEIYLDSLDSQSTYDTDFSSTDWPLFQLATPIPNLGAMKVLEVQIPFSFYIFNSSNNTFTLTDNSVTNGLVTIPVGNYTSTTLTTALAAALNASGTARTYTVTFAGQSSGPNTGKFTITGSTSTSYSFALTFGGSTADTGTTNPRLFLGFQAGAPAGNTSNTALTPVLVAPNAANIAGPNYLYLNSRMLGPQLTTLLPRGAVNLGNGTAGPQLAKIPINVQPGGIIYWTDPSPLFWFSLENMALLSQFDMYLTIGNNEVPQATRLNGVSFSVKLGLLKNKLTVEQSYQGRDGNTPASTVIGGRKRTSNF